MTGVATLKDKAARITVGNEPLTYRSPMQGGRHSLFADMLAAGTDPPARARLMKHAEESETRDVYYGGGADGFLAPAWLADEAADIARAPRVLSDLFRSVPLPDHEQLQVPHVTTGVDVGVESPENSLATSVDLASEVKSYNITEIAGRLGVARASLDRSAPSLDMVLFSSMEKAYNAKLEAQLLSGSGAANQLLGLNSVGSSISVTYTSGTPDAGACMLSIAQAISKVSTQRFVTEIAVILHPRRATWLASATGQTSLSDFPAFSDYGLNVTWHANQSISTSLGAGTNQDQIVVCHPQSFFIAESDALRFREDNSKSSTAAAHVTYAGWVAAATDLYPKALAIVNGTGLTAPVNF
jgi:HK97 family phage major capsid protein